MKKKHIFLLGLLTLLGILTACRKSIQVYQPFIISYQPSLYESSRRNFIPHIGPDRWDNYLSMDLPFSPAFSVFEQLEEMLKVRLRHRGEAHITVITPVEYWNQLKPFLSIQEINEMALDLNLQHSHFQVQCLGSGKKWFFPFALEETYFMVVHSSDLIKFRHKVKERFIKNGGSSEVFDPEHYFPHITIGFTKRDLHESDGVFKDQRSCDNRVKLIKR